MGQKHIFTGLFIRVEIKLLFCHILSYKWYNKESSLIYCEIYNQVISLGIIIMYPNHNGTCLPF